MCAWSLPLTFLARCSRLRGHRFRSPRGWARRPAGFTLVELLVTLMLVALLLMLLVPTLLQARRHARHVQMLTDLTALGHALDAYELTYRTLPPTRKSCGGGVELPMPVELGVAGLVDWSRRSADGAVGALGDVARDKLSPTDAPYRYKAPGAAILNGSEWSLRGSMLWVPDDAPTMLSARGRFIDRPGGAVVQAAIWSMGVDPQADVFAEGWAYLPLPQRFWSTGIGQPGVSVRFRGGPGTWMGPATPPN